MQKILMILNESPYGNERTYNALRYGILLSQQKEINLKLFLVGDAVASAKKGQKVPSGYYNAEIMLVSVIKNNVETGICGTCIDARGIKAEELVEGVHRSSMAELTAWTLDADKIVTF
ncbi:MAG: hypothetical protein A3J83_09205 [Elusimicrobia bacterium RIFOXYA2_FULL_40_6]|nr:MAG: hypothetical protein A3J83_09205 [Elusimicrobia bacterium RIFOXYA2_FULL_40_6]